MKEILQKLYEQAPTETIKSGAVFVCGEDLESEPKEFKGIEVKRHKSLNRSKCVYLMTKDDYEKSISQLTEIEQ